MNENLKKMFGYYKPYKGIFCADMFFATISALVALTIPLVVRYVTSTLIYEETDVIVHQILFIALGLFVLLAVDCYSKFFIGNYGHVMGARMEYDMRAELFAHLQKLSFSFYDDAKVGQLMSRVTSDLFDITELLHHGPENIILSLLKIVGALIILLNINGWLALAAFIVLPFMFWFAFALNQKMRAAFKINRVKIAEINEQLIKAKLEIKSMLKEKVELSKDIMDKFLVLNKDDRLKFMDSLNNEERILDFKRKLYKRIITEKNAEDLMILIWATGELKDDRFLALLHPLTGHRHSDVRRITYSAIRKIESPSSREYLQRGLYDSNPQTRQYCAKALAKIGNKNSLKMLKQLRNKKNFEKEYVLRAYEEAISMLEKDI